MMKMGEFVEDDIVTQDFWDLHEADVEGDGAIARTTTPACGSVAETAFVVGVAVEFSIIFKTIGQVVLCFFHEDFFLGVAGALSAGA